MMKKTAKSRSTESSAAAERLADYKGDFSNRIGAALEGAASPLVWVTAQDPRW